MIDLRLSTFDIRLYRSAPAVDVVYQMRNELCQFLFQKGQQLLGTFEGLASRQLLQAEGPVEDGVSAEIAHGSLDRMGCAVEQLPILGVDRPPQLVQALRMLLQEGLRDVSQ